MLEKTKVQSRMDTGNIGTQDTGRGQTKQNTTQKTKKMRNMECANCLLIILHLGWKSNCWYRFLLIRAFSQNLAESVVILCQIDLQLPVQSVHITT